MQAISGVRGDIPFYSLSGKQQWLIFLLHHVIGAGIIVGLSTPYGDYAEILVWVSCLPIFIAFSFNYICNIGNDGSEETCYAAPNFITGIACHSPLCLIAPFTAWFDMLADCAWVPVDHSAFVVAVGHFLDTPTRSSAFGAMVQSFVQLYFMLQIYLDSGFQEALFLGLVAIPNLILLSISTPHFITGGPPPDEQEEMFDDEESAVSPPSEYDAGNPEYLGDLPDGKLPY